MCLQQAGDYLSQAEYSTDNSVEEQNTFKLVNQLVNNNRLRSACPVPYDEAKIWKGENGRELKSQVQSQFKTIRFTLYGDIIPDLASIQLNVI